MAKRRSPWEQLQVDWALRREKVRREISLYPELKDREIAERLDVHRMLVWRVRNAGRPRGYQRTSLPDNLISLPTPNAYKVELAEIEWGTGASLGARFRNVPDASTQLAVIDLSTLKRDIRRDFRDAGKLVCRIGVPSVQLVVIIPDEQFNVIQSLVRSSDYYGQGLTEISFHVLRVHSTSDAPVHREMIAVLHQDDVVSNLPSTVLDIKAMPRLDPAHAVRWVLIHQFTSHGDQVVDLLGTSASVIAGAVALDRRCFVGAEDDAHAWRLVEDANKILGKLTPPVQ